MFSFNMFFLIFLQCKNSLLCSLCQKTFAIKNLTLRSTLHIRLTHPALLLATVVELRQGHNHRQWGGHVPHKIIQISAWSIWVFTEHRLWLLWNGGKSSDVHDWCKAAPHSKRCLPIAVFLYVYIVYRFIISGPSPRPPVKRTGWDFCWAIIQQIFAINSVVHSQLLIFWSCIVRCYVNFSLLNSHSVTIYQTKYLQKLYFNGICFFLRRLEKCCFTDLHNFSLAQSRF